MTITEIADFIQSQIEWRGPTGQKQGHIVIARMEAEVLLAYLKQYGGDQGEATHVRQADH